MQFCCIIYLFQFSLICGLLFLIYRFGITFAVCEVFLLLDFSGPISPPPFPHSRMRNPILKRKQTNWISALISRLARLCCENVALLLVSITGQVSSGEEEGWRWDLRPKLVEEERNCVETVLRLSQFLEAG